MNKVIAIDFDGTLCENAYPAIGAANSGGIGPMATTKMIVIRYSMEAAIEYAENDGKTSAEREALEKYAAHITQSRGYSEQKGHFGTALDYAMRGDKTDVVRFVTGHNCGAEAAKEDMAITRARFGKEAAVRQGYHLIQSFRPGEVTPEVAHQIGVEMVQRLLGDRFEAVVATHIDREHIHNHILWNSVSWLDGKMAHYDKSFYFKDVRGASDVLCRENSLSVVVPARGRLNSRLEVTDTATGLRVFDEPKGRARGRGDGTVRAKVAVDMDGIIARSATWKEFIDNLRSAGYGVRQGAELKHFAIRTPSGTRIRTASLGARYTEEALRERIRRNSMNPAIAVALERADEQRKNGAKKRSVALRGNFKPTKLHGYRALYFRYLYMLGKVPKRGANRRAARYLKTSVKRVKATIAQEQLLRTAKISTLSELKMYMSATEDEIYRLTRERAPLYRNMTRAGERLPETEARELRDALTEELRRHRANLKLAYGVEQASTEVRSELGAAREFAAASGGVRESARETRERSSTEAYNAENMSK